MSKGALFEKMKKISKGEVVKKERKEGDFVKLSSSERGVFIGICF